MICRSLANCSCSPRVRRVSPRGRRASFTLVELMVVMSIIGVLASAVLMAMYGVMEQAKAVRTKAQIAKLHELIMAKWQSYNTRTLRVTLPPLQQPPPPNPPRRWPVIPETFVDTNVNGKWDTGEPFLPPAVPNGDPNGNTVYDSGTARVRLDMLRDLMRMELPDRISDLTDSSRDPSGLRRCHRLRSGSPTSAVRMPRSKPGTARPQAGRTRRSGPHRIRARNACI